MGILQKGQLVTSKMGRDSGKKYVVVKICNDGHVQVSDGFVRKTTRPKRKNLKHIVVHQAILGIEFLEDKAIQEFIKQHSTEEKVGEEARTEHGER